MKLIYLIGIPGTGKTTIMREFMNRVGPWIPERPAELLDTMRCASPNEKLRILGKYEEGETFAGTDRLSMAVAPKAIEWMETKPNEVIIGEGDRLANKGFFKSAGDDLVIFHIKTSDEERQRRYKERGSNQDESFIKTTKTKCKNLIEEFGAKQTLFGEESGYVREFTHETPEDTRKIVMSMLLESSYN